MSLPRCRKLSFKTSCTCLDLSPIPAAPFPHIHPGRFFQALPIAVFSCSNHAVAFPVFHEMRHQTVAGFTYVASRTYTVVLALYALTG